MRVRESKRMCYEQREILFIFRSEQRGRVLWNDKKKVNLFGVVSGELEDNLLSGQAAVDGAEGIELVLQGGRVLGIKEAIL